MLNIFQFHLFINFSVTILVLLFSLDLAWTQYSNTLALYFNLDETVNIDRVLVEIKSIFLTEEKSDEHFE